MNLKEGKRRVKISSNQMSEFLEKNSFDDSNIKHFFKIMEDSVASNEDTVTRIKNLKDEFLTGIGGFESKVSQYKRQLSSKDSSFSLARNFDYYVPIISAVVLIIAGIVFWICP